MIILSLLLIVAILLAAAWYSKRFRAPGKTAAAIVPLAGQEDREARLKAHVARLAGTIGERSQWAYEGLQEAAAYIGSRFEEAGLEVVEQEYRVEGKTVANLVAERRGTKKPGEIVLIGAHYDAVEGTVGANDNGSGVAALLEISRALAGRPAERTLRLAAFVNEEPPFFKTSLMGSRVYAREARQRGDRIVAMLCLETIGYFTQKTGSQEFPFPPLRLFYPNRGNFVAFVANFGSRRLLRRSLNAFRGHSDFPAEGLVAPEWLMGVDWSDHWSFWRSGYPAVMVTDTAPFRYPFYHSPGDTPDKLAYPDFARAVSGLIAVAADLAGIDWDTGVGKIP